MTGVVLGSQLAHSPESGWLPIGGSSGSVAIGEREDVGHGVAGVEPDICRPTG
jgi:hypothetical protein